MYSKFWMIVNIANADNVYQGEAIPRKDAPTMMHHEKDNAEKELLRLQAKHSDAEFILLEAVAFAQEKKRFFVEPITQIFQVDEIPF